ncbi:AgrD family cyclic lactone autoinducer peptide [Defluviitalea phaphyphila]|nr:cyclic lactone autoinducer peptide [Defluviitalea phaphyphila]
MIKRKILTPVLLSLANFFVLAAYTTKLYVCFYMWGEPKCPKDLLK